MDEGEGGLGIGVFEEARASAPGNVVFDAASCCSAVRSGDSKQMDHLLSQ